jgi:Flp pilus assembly protein TadB
MLDASSIFYLAMFTLTAGLVVGSVQYARVRRSQKRDHRYDRWSTRATRRSR